MTRFLAVRYSLIYLGFAATFVYLLFLGFYQQVAPRALREIFIWPSVLGLIYIYWQGYRTLKSHNVKNPVTVIVAFGLLFAGICLFVPPFHSTDVFGYINRGWEQIRYGMNPYVHPIQDIPQWSNDPMLTDHWVNNPSPYGFLFMLLMKFLTGLGLGNRALTLFLVKLINFSCWAASGLLIWGGSRHLKLPRPEVSLYLYCWSPLVLLNTMSNGHNDIMMAFFLILAAYCAIRKVWLWIMPALLLGTLIKYSLLSTIPLALYWMSREFGWRKTLISLSIGLVFTLLISSPYISEISQFNLDKIGDNVVISHNSLHSVIYYLLDTVSIPLPALSAAVPILQRFLKYLFIVGYTVFLGGQLYRCSRYPHFTPTLFIRETLLNQFLLICVFSIKFFPWYLIVFLPLSFYLSPTDNVRRLTLLFSVTELLTFTFIGRAHFINYSLMMGMPFLLYWLAKQNRVLSLSLKEILT